METARAADLGAGDPDWELLARVAAGDGDAYLPLVERHQERLLRLCERLLGEREEARDAVQEVFLKAFRHAASAEPRGQLFTWLYRIAVNHCLNRLRRRRIFRGCAKSWLRFSSCCRRDVARRLFSLLFRGGDGSAYEAAARAAG